MNDHTDQYACRPLTRLWGLSGCLASTTVLLSLLVNAGCRRNAATTSSPSSNVAQVAMKKDASAERPREQQIEQFCGDCHATPKPESFPKEMWYSEVKRGFDFYFDSRRTDLQVPIQAQVTEYFRDRAPTQLDWGTAPSTADTSPVRLIREDWPDEILSFSDPPAISFLDHALPENNSNCWISDMRSGRILFGDLERHHWQTLSHPATNPVAVRVCDLNGNQIPDLLITDLGSFLPADHQLGQVLWMPDVTEPSSVQLGAPLSLNAKVIPLLQNVGRVADVQTGDLDGDGDVDVVVGEFGWHRTGGVHILWNELGTRTGDAIAGSFRQEVLDRRPGAIHVACTDFNGDGRPDVVALLSQEHETIVAWLNQAQAISPRGFELVPHTLYAANDPSAGSSGMVVADLDQDGDDDVVYTNGDTFDSFINKPSHGVWWFENCGEWPFTVHRLTGLPGAHRAIPVDLDQDGDLDLAVCAFVPEKLRGLIGKEHLQGVIWLEQRATGEFVRHLIDRDDPSHAAMTVYDIDGDGDSDLVTGAFREGPGGSRTAVTVFRNAGVHSR